MLDKLLRRQNKHEEPIDTDQIHSSSIKTMLEKLDHNQADNKDHHVRWITMSDKNKTPLMKINDLSKTFSKGHHKNEVLKNITFSINEGENVAILGGNGAGKTTLVEILAGLNKPTSGSVDIEYEYDNSYLEKIGIQFQDSSYPPGISVKNVIDFMIDVYKINVTKEEIKSLLKIFAIDKFYLRRASSLSGGEQQRLNAFIAIIHKPKIIFLDELSTGLDISIRTRIKEFIKEYAKENNMTITLVSHDMGEIEYLCERIIFLKNGEIYSDVHINDIKEHFQSLENFVQYYLDDQ